MRSSAFERRMLFERGGERHSSPDAMVVPVRARLDRPAVLTGRPGDGSGFPPAAAAAHSCVARLRADIAPRELSPKTGRSGRDRACLHRRATFTNH